MKLFSGLGAECKTASPLFLTMTLMMTLAILLAGVAAAHAENHVIVQKGRTFHPGEITINKNDSLVVTNDDEFIHQIYVAGNGFSFDSEEKSPGQNITETFTKSGTFEVHCHIHPKMKLVVHVK